MYVCVSTFSNIFSSETTKAIEAKFHMESPWDSGTKVCSNGPGHMTKWPPCPYMVKTLKSLLLRNQRADDLETWYAASGALVFSNDDPGLSLVYFTARSKLGRVKRICVFEHSVMKNFNCSCPAIQRGQGSGFLPEGSS